MLNLNELREKQQSTYKKIEQLKNLVETIINTTIIDSLRETYEGNGVIEDIDGLLELLQSNKITISVVAEVSLGKSTFLNALIFRDSVLDSGGRAVTARLFKVDYGEKYTITNDNRTEELSSITELKNVVKNLNERARNEISSDNRLSEHREDILITLPNEMLKQGVSLYDTPGFGSTDQAIIYDLIKKAVSKSDATVILINPSQGVKQSEESFIKDVMKAIVPEKRYVVLNRFDEVISEDQQILMSERDLHEEIDKLEQSTIQELSDIAGVEKNEITLYMLSSSKALAGYQINDIKRIEESQFDTFEKDFWKKVINTKEKVYEERIERANNQVLKVQSTIINLREILINEKDEVEKLVAGLDNQYKLFTSFSNDAKKELRLIMEQSKNRQQEVFDTKSLMDESEKIICGQIYQSIEKIGAFDKAKVWSLKNKYIQRAEEALEDSMILIAPGIESYISNIEETIFDIQSDLNQVVQTINNDLEEYKDYNIEKLDEIDLVINTDGHIRFNTDSKLYKDISIDKEVFVLLSGIISEIVITRLTTLIPGLGLAIATAIAIAMMLYKKYQDPNKELAKKITVEIMKEFEKKLTEAFKDINEFGRTFNDTLTLALGNYIAKIDAVKRALESPEAQQEEVEHLNKQVNELNVYLEEVQGLLK